MKKRKVEEKECECLETQTECPCEEEKKKKRGIIFGIGAAVAAGIAATVGIFLAKKAKKETEDNEFIDE